MDYDLERKEIVLEQRNYFKKGDIVEFFGPNTDTVSFEIKTIIDNNGEEIDVVRYPKQIVRIPFEYILEIDSMMRIKR